ncbi:aminomethyl-transferring glycine dehydrogenase [Ignavibacteria bacterium]|nr:aminomethyl-transferring glycine dehydrogenase [Bacteroidota bacterium]MCZ2133340.1 aminomethyl-transferring glycine dehydrogenase [Bacteroidota bacterium]
MNERLTAADSFRNRHIGPNSKETERMLKVIGIDSVDALIDLTVPAAIRLTKSIEVCEPQTEPEFLTNLRSIASENCIFKSYIGTGYYDTLTPAVILRNLLENPGWYTQYTPYQAEIAQGRLESLLNYQTMVIDLTGLPVANASLLDEATAAAEAMHLFHAVAKTGAHKLFASDKLFPQTLDALKTRCAPIGVELVIGNHKEFSPDASFFGAIVQYPDADGSIEDYRAFCAKAKAHHCLTAVATDLLALTMLTPPGEFGADVAFGSAQRFGVPMGYGGPHAAFFAARDEYKRQMPGRIIGVSIDAAGNTAYRMALQTREQHIKREKATSNICTAQALLANIAAMYTVYHGPKGLRKIAEKINALTCVLAKGLEIIGYGTNANFFDTLTIELPNGTLQTTLRKSAENAGINLRYDSSGKIGISLDETTTIADVQTLLNLFAGESASRTAAPSAAELGKNICESVPEFAQRKSAYLTHPTFNRYHSEHEMLRYMKRLENKDLSLAHSMIPLGSCTMKLNATAEMIPITWREFGGLHPFAPRGQAAGYMRIFDEFERWLCEITGFDAASLQPNAGAQGEYAGLLVISAYHQSRGDGHRNVALIPQSAHGTNPASAVMAGMKVVVVKCDSMGNIDVEDLRTKAEQYSSELAALMITYPSTHGVFEESVIEICGIIHKCGGQVYMDGANMNAQVGLTSPRQIGADVCHLNLHKTFSIPHGGGGPGMGPICVAAHLSPFLPGHPIIEVGGDKAISAVSAAPWGSASIILISYAYIAMLGGRGLTDATKYAILNANYLKARLEPYFPILYTGAGGYVAHEMIADMRHFKQTAGIEVEDIAKRLMDYGFHAPTVSFPVPGTLMIEPTESESLEELDRFCEAMTAIRKEIAEVENGTVSREDNPLKNAPHTAAIIAADDWNHGYSRKQAAFPLHWVSERKFWPSVGRVNNTYGDRSLVCACPPIEDYI